MSCPDMHLSVWSARTPRITLTKHISGVDLQDDPAVPVLFVRTKDGEDGALFSWLRQQAVNKDWLLREGKRFPGFPFVCAVSG